jgi:hypothetical protein
VQRGSRLIDEPDGKNVKDWIISSQAPKLAMIEHGEGSESRRLWVLNDGLINLIMLKVYSGLTRNGKDYGRQNHTMLTSMGIDICK